MKKWMGICMVLCMSAAFVGCGKNANNTNEDVSQNVAEDANNDSKEDEKESSIADSVTLLSSVWEAIPEGERFAAAGGDFSPENQVTDAPGKFGLNDTEALDATLGFPAAEVGGIDEAASLVHMMNANTFTSGAFHATDAANVDSLVAKIKDNLLNRQWMCGMPDKLVVETSGQYIVVIFGESELVDLFQGKMEGVYPEMKVVVDEPIAGK